MALTTTTDIANADREAYLRYRMLTGVDRGLPSGWIAHQAGPIEGGWRMVDLWESGTICDRFENDLLSRVRIQLNMRILCSDRWNVVDQVGSLITTHDRMLKEEPSAPPPWLTGSVVDALVEAGRRSIPSRDVPVAAALLYKKEMFIGWNDAAAALKAAGHAEINAITNAIRHYGSAQRFKELNREKLYFVSTFEPCPMCMGALAEHRIKPDNVVVLMRKEEEHRRSELEACDAVRNGYNYIGYDHVQTSLFWQHPGYQEYQQRQCRGEKE